MPTLQPWEVRARENIAEWVKLYRDITKELSGMRNDQDVAALLGLSKSHFSEVKSGSGSGGYKVVLSLRETYGASIDAMVDREPTPADKDRARSDVSRALAQRHKHAAG